MWNSKGTRVSTLFRFNSNLIHEDVLMYKRLLQAVSHTFNIAHYVHSVLYIMASIIYIYLFLYLQNLIYYIDLTFFKRRRFSRSVFH